MNNRASADGNANRLARKLTSKSGCAISSGCNHRKNIEQIVMSVLKILLKNIIKLIINTKKIPVLIMPKDALKKILRIVKIGAKLILSI